MTISSIVNEVISVLGSMWTFITANPVLIFLVGAPVVIGVLGAFVSLFRSR